MVMSEQSRYWRLVRLDSTGQARFRPLPPIKTWFQTCFDQQAEAGVQTQLLDLWRRQSPDQMAALLSLRCFVSHSILQGCRQLVQAFGQRYQFTLTDLLAYVLDDDGSPPGPYQPLTMKILETYDAAKGKLTTWTFRLTQSHPEINRELLDRGLYRASDWALLNDTAPSQLQRILAEVYGHSQAEVEQAVMLLERYHEVYRQMRLELRLAGKGSHRCEPPTPEQLRQMDDQRSPEVVLAQLQAIADRLRNYKVQVRQKAPFTQSIDALEDWEIPAPAVEEDPADQFLQHYREQLQQSLATAIAESIHARRAKLARKNPPQDQLFVQGLARFHCQGMAMAAIAAELGLKNQVQVTRLLDLRRFRGEVRNRLLPQLQAAVRTQAQAFVDPEELATLASQIDRLLAETVDEVMAEAAAEAQTPKHRPTHSRFARQLCQTIHAFLEPES